eukprot:1161110-Pelagomonas_calceolata.AAC.16
MEQARREGLSEAAAQIRGANVLGAILDAQNAQVPHLMLWVAGAQLGVDATGLLHDLEGVGVVHEGADVLGMDASPPVVAVLVPADARTELEGTILQGQRPAAVWMQGNLSKKREGIEGITSLFHPVCRQPITEVQLTAGKSLLGSVASALTSHVSTQAPRPDVDSTHHAQPLASPAKDAATGPGLDVSRLVVWGRVGRKGHRAKLPPVVPEPSAAAPGPAQPPATPAKLQPEPPEAVPGTAPPLATPPKLKPEAPAAAPGIAPSPATPPRIQSAQPASPEPGLAEERGEKRAREGQGGGSPEEGDMPPPAKLSRAEGAETAEPGRVTKEGKAMPAAYSTETRVEHKGPASMDWDDMKPEGRPRVRQQ